MGAKQTNTTKKLKKILPVAISALAFSYFGMFTNSVFANTPQSLYDQVWKIVSVKFLDPSENAQDWNKWRHRYDNSIKTDADAYLAIQTMLASLNDPYTRFLDPEAFADEGNSIKGTLFGIGIQIGIKDEKIVVISPIEDTPAAKAGLLSNDEIIKIDQKSTKGISVKEAADRIRGEEGTTVTIEVKRGEELKSFTIARSKINVKSVSLIPPKGIKVENNMGYIKLNSFISSNAADEVKDALEKLNTKSGYIIDLRSNPGGLLSNAVKIADMLLDGGVIVSTVDRDGYKQTQKSDKATITDKPVVLLIDSGSASASEILSGALKDNGRATLVGTKSFGKGIVQEINRLPDGSGMNITIQKYLTPNDTDINKKGIMPDYTVKVTTDDVRDGKDPQLMKAEEVLSTQITKYNTEHKNEASAIEQVKTIVK
ncbi:MAG: S41 family peptidase [bacterium]